MISIRKIVQTMVVVGCLAGLFGCGGGGGGSTASTTPSTPAKATTTVSGKVDFPSLSSLVAKRVNLGEPITVTAFTIDGVLVGSAVADSSGNFIITGLDSGIDYVLKATRGTQVLKKLIEKAAIAPGVTVSNQDISGVSTTAVVVASQKLAPAGVTNFNLGEPLTLTEAQKTTISTNIFTVSPKDLETAISTAATTVQTALTNNDLSSLTSQLAELVNTLNLIVAAVSSNVDPTKVATGQVQSFAVTPDVLKPLVVTGGVVTQGAALTGDITSSTVQAIVTSSVAAYVPPSRVNLDVTNDAPVGTLYGIAFDIILPADATVKLDSNNKPAFTLAPGVTLSCLATATLQGSVLKVVIADVSPLPTGKLVSFVFDKTPGVTLTNTNFPLTYTKASDSTGNPLLSSFSLTSVVTSSGS